jgi:hypothetical protein
MSTLITRLGAFILAALCLGSCTYKMADFYEKEYVQRPKIPKVGGIRTIPPGGKNYKFAIRLNKDSTFNFVSVSASLYYSEGYWELGQDQRTILLHTQRLPATSEWLGKYSPVSSGGSALYRSGFRFVDMSGDTLLIKDRSRFVFSFTAQLRWEQIGQPLGSFFLVK